ncbi:ComC/BlpC family leader-containing pheromone/bacteriocin [Streptococcus pluranimalium]
MNTKTITSFQEIQLETLSKINGGAKDEFSKMMYNT